MEGKKTKEGFRFITVEYKSNCMFEALKEKIKNPKSVKIYYFKPFLPWNGTFQWFHFMWSDGEFDYDFSYVGKKKLRRYECFWFDGRVRRFERDYAKRLIEFRDKLNELHSEYREIVKRGGLR